MTTVVYTPSGWVPLAGVPAGPGPDPEDPKVPPPAVIILSVLSPSPTELTASWLAPTDPNAGGYIHHYEVDVNGVEYNYSLTSTSITVTGLEPDTEYTVTVRAVNNFFLSSTPSSSTAWTQVEPPPDPEPPASWQAAVDSKDIDQVFAWYDQNIGLAGVGITDGSSLPSGSLSTTHDGQVIEGVRGGGIRIRHNNVTIRRCAVYVTGSGYGVSFGDAFGSNLRGAVIEDCDIIYTATANANETRHALILYNNTSPSNTARSVTVRRCKIEGFTSAGGRLGNNVTMEYCAVRRFQYPPGPHANALRPAGHNVIARRNLLTEGRSAISSIYFDDRAVSNLLYEENILYGVPPASPSYWVNGKSGEYQGQASDIVWRNNWYGGYYQFGEYTDNVPWGVRGNQHYGDKYFDTGELAPFNHS